MASKTGTLMNRSAHTSYNEPASSLKTTRPRALTHNTIFIHAYPVPYPPTTFSRDGMSAVSFIVVDLSLVGERERDN